MKNKFKRFILKKAAKRPSHIREGQAVFNIVDEIFGIARELQLKYHIDCFYDDSKINDFIDKAYTLASICYTEHELNKIISDNKNF